MCLQGFLRWSAFKIIYIGVVLQKIIFFFLTGAEDFLINNFLWFIGPSARKQDFSNSKSKGDWIPNCKRLQQHLAIAH
jgi:hypothetical protein